MINEYVLSCKENCNRNVTVNDIIQDIDCNFCDVPYIFLEKNG